MKISVKIIQGRTEITVESDNPQEIIERLDDVRKVLEKVKVLYAKEPASSEAEPDDLPPSSSEWTSEY